MTMLIRKHATPIKWAGTLLIPAVLISFWLWAGTLLGQDGTSNVSGISSPEAALPTIGTSLTAGGVFYLVMAFLQKTIDRYESEKKEIRAEWKALLDAAALNSSNLLTLAYRDRDLWASKYQTMVDDVLDDTKSLRVAQSNLPKPRRQT